MKTAIILNGNVRTWTACKDNFNQTFGDLNPDIFVSTYDMQYGYHPEVRRRFNDYVDYRLDQEDIMELFSDINLKAISIEKLADVENIVNQENGKLHPSLQNMGNCYGQYRKFKIGTDMIQHHENQHNFVYDTIIKTRCDLIYNPIDFIVPDDCVLIDSGNVFPNDCFIMSSRNNVMNISNFIMNEFYNPVFGDSNSNPPHGLLLNAVKHGNMNFKLDRIMNHVLRKELVQDFY